ncbi:hypothetical protein OG747_16490 [Streptomyces sp. NBC_01384]|uniref:hypothetical protein n=1 Tax=Streptomyces sp. NBC_01384 TaxID=2903847 RepID=UPI0032526ECA
MTNGTTTDVTGPSADLSAAESVSAPLRERSVRGRHRKPRPRRVLFAVGGLALAAGVSLVRMTPDSMVGDGSGGVNAEAEPRAGVATDEAVDASPTAWIMPSAYPTSPETTSAMGGANATPTSGVLLAPTPPSAAPSPAAAIPSARADDPVGGAPDSTGIPTAPVAASRPHAQPPAASAPAPQPTPSANPHAPAPRPSQNPPGLCVPLVGICVNDLAGPAGNH